MTVEWAEIDGLEVFEGTGEIFPLSAGQVDERIADGVHMYIFMLVRSDRWSPDFFHYVIVEMNISLS